MKVTVVVTLILTVKVVGTVNEATITKIENAALKVTETVTVTVTEKDT